MISAADAELRQIPIDRIRQNPENPRLLFRQAEMDDLLASIKAYGVQVPVSVYREKQSFVLLDGERRWRSALKLNLKTIPALVQEKPSRLQNILLMFNIHALREQWDLLTIAMKLGDVIDLLNRELGRPSTEAEIALRTGLSRGPIRRCRLLLDLPDRYRQMILAELSKPKRKQRLTEDFFIEMERALKTVERKMPDALPDKNEARRVLIQKFKGDVIQNRVHFRMLPKIANASRVSADPRQARLALRKLFGVNSYSIEAAYEDSVSSTYAERDIASRLEALLARLSGLAPQDVDEELSQRLEQLIREAKRLLGR